MTENGNQSGSKSKSHLKLVKSESKQISNDYVEIDGKLYALVGNIFKPIKKDLTKPE